MEEVDELRDELEERLDILEVTKKEDTPTQMGEPGVNEIVEEQEIDALVNGVLRKYKKVQGQLFYWTATKV